MPPPPAYGAAPLPPAAVGGGDQQQQQQQQQRSATTTTTSTTVFVTVGSTKFDPLIRAVDQPRFADALVARGYTRLVMQIGRCAVRCGVVAVRAFGCRTLRPSPPAERCVLPPPSCHPPHLTLSGGTVPPLPFSCLTAPHPPLLACLCLPCRAEYTPRRLLPPNSRCARLHSGLWVEYFDFAPSLAEHLRGAALVISHAGERAPRCAAATSDAKLDPCVRV